MANSRLILTAGSVLIFLFGVLLGMRLSLWVRADVCVPKPPRAEAIEAPPRDPLEPESDVWL